MAGIDKTYVNTWEDFNSIRDWAQSVGTVTDDYGNKLTPFNWLYYPDLTEEEFHKNQDRCWKEAKKRYSNVNDIDQEYVQYMKEKYGEDFLEHPELFYEVVIWNTSHIEDIFLIRHCPLEVIQNRLKEQYSSGWSKMALTHHNESSMYEQIKNQTSIYDTYIRPKGSAKFTIKYIINRKFKDKKVWWWIDITGSNEYWWYDEVENKWYNDLECHDSKSDRISSICTKFHGNLSKRKVYRLLRHWNLPSGTIVHFCGDWHRITMKDFFIKIK